MLWTKNVPAWTCFALLGSPFVRTSNPASIAKGSGRAGTDQESRGRAETDLGDLYAESGQTLQGSFSSVSKPYVASKYSLEFAPLSYLKIFVKNC